MKYGICRANCYATTFFEVACELTDKFFDCEGNDYVIWSGSLPDFNDLDKSMQYNHVTWLLTHLSKNHWKVGNRVKDFLPSVISLLSDHLRNTDPYLEWVSKTLLEEFGLKTHRTQGEDYNFMMRDFVLLCPLETDEVTLKQLEKKTSRIQNPYGIISL